MGRRDPDFTSDGLYLPDDVSAMADAFKVACAKLGALADQDEVRRAMAIVIAHHYDMGLRRTDRMVASAASLGRIVGKTPDLPGSGTAGRRTAPAGVRDTEFGP
ncbi:hypothetical protein C6569_15895 [Phreatobacter cathodiphilus]|uniref:Uncharacterized protein n=1 Tax=Phreatobacter cathodiphilus TaxID=1868589 RepID=A0A2S0NEF1_9HYPH|nr:hypothetical protein C6569_15895 [Phreatobacter cathodiphilus]